MLPIAHKFYQKGFVIYATAGTAKFLAAHDIYANVVEKIWEGKDSIIDLIQSGKTAMALRLEEQQLNVKFRVLHRQIP